MASFRDKIAESGNKKFTGKKYKVGWMEHRRVVELGKLKCLKYVIVSESDRYTIGVLEELKTVKSKSYSVSNTTSLSVSIAQGFSQVANTGIKLDSVGEVGTSNSKSTNLGFTYSKVYSTSEVKSETVEVKYDINQLCANQTSFSVGQVALIAVFEVKASYTQEERLNKWCKINNPYEHDYEVHYFANTVTTFIYEQGFGDKKAGFYLLGEIIF